MHVIINQHMLQPSLPAQKSTLVSPWSGLTTGQIIVALWRYRLRVLLITGLFATLGVVAAFLTKPEFKSEAKIMPEINNGAGDAFKRLASVADFAGIDLEETEAVDAVRPDLYPNVLQSTPFILYLLDQKVATKKGERPTLSEFLESNQSWSIGKLFTKEDTAKQAVKNVHDQPVELTKRQQDLVEDIQKRVTARLDTRSGIITITTKMPDPNVAAAVAQLAMTYLTQYVTSYRTEKARQDLLFYQQRLGETRRRYENAQRSVFAYNDQHLQMVVEAGTMGKYRREAELAVAQTVYTELSRQYEQAKLKVQERTPIFKVLEPANVPLMRTSPKRTVMVLICTLIGSVIGSLYALASQIDALTRIKRWLEPANAY